MAELNFILPPGAVSLEGGGAYIRALTAALSAGGHRVSRNAPALPGVIQVIDGAMLPHVSPERSAGAIGLIHHPTALARPEDHVAIRKAERERLALLAGIVATNVPVRDRLVAEFAVDPGRVALVQPGVPDVPRSAFQEGAECRLLSVGALVPRKGHGVLLRALARLWDLPWRLVIAGDDTRDPACAAALRQQAQDCGIAARVRFTGTLPPDELAAAWAEADLFALATEWEGYASAVAEALRRGLPVAVTAGGGAADQVTPDAGIVCPPGDADQMSKAMRRVIFDTALRRDMADAAWQLGQSLPGWPAQATRFLEAVQCC